MTNATRPDMDGLITGGQDRRRRRNLALMGGVAAAAVLVGGGVYGIAQLDGGDGDSKTASEPTEGATSEPAQSGPRRYVDLNGADLEPGTYRKVVGVDGEGPIEADITFEGQGWGAGNQPTVWDGEDWAGVAVYSPEGLASGSGCMSDPLNQDLGRTPSRLAAQLARLPQSEVVQPPTPTAAFGLDAVHLRVRIDNQCPDDDGYLLAETVAGSHGINYGETASPVVIDFWVVDVDGTPVVVEVFREGDTPEKLLRQANSARDSVSFVTDGQE